MARGLPRSRAPVPRAPPARPPHSPQGVVDWEVAKRRHRPWCDAPTWTSSCAVMDLTALAARPLRAAARPQRVAVPRRPRAVGRTVRVAARRRPPARWTVAVPRDVAAPRRREPWDPWVVGARTFASCQARARSAGASQDREWSPCRRAPRRSSSPAECLQVRPARFGRPTTQPSNAPPRR